MNASWGGDRARRPPLSRYRASTEPAPASHSIHPRALMSGHLPHTIHTPDLFFSNPRPSSSSPPPPVPPHPYNAPVLAQSYPPPIPPLPPGINIHRTMTAPPIPPKPTSRPRPYASFSASAASPSTTSGPLNPTTTQPTPQQDLTSSDRDEDGLALAFALSQSVAHNEQRMRDKLSTQEEEDLARALKESLMFTSIPSCSPAAMETSFTSPASGSTTSSVFHPEEDEVSMLVEPANNEMLAQDEALALRLALEEADTVVTPDTPRTTSPPALRETSTLTDHTPDTTRHATSTPSSPNIHASGSAPQLPTYIDVVRTSTTPGSSSSGGPSTDDSHGGHSSTSPHLSQNAEASHSHARDSFLMPSHSLHRASSTASLISSQNSVSETNPTPNPAAPNVNQFVDPQLFQGVSIGFFAPPISTDLITTLAVMPNIISLPYGKCPPLHLQGPSWRHLLMLMARLSGTRLEATLEAVAVNKTEMKLRTVVQFVKPLRTSTEWRTILYFTLDYPPPRSGDTRQSVNALPYSYSLSTIPTLLREAADTPISKTYTIPASDAVPYPTLPINFPNLAMYLQAALEESRRYLNDSSSGHRKLAKMVQTCYPSRAGDGLKDAPERSSVGGLIKRVIGRNNRSNRTGGNEDTYELVTPFVPDEWG